MIPSWYRWGLAAQLPHPRKIISREMGKAPNAIFSFRCIFFWETVKCLFI
jgi:hypothetical protein